MLSATQIHHAQSSDMSSTMQAPKLLLKPKVAVIVVEKDAILLTSISTQESKIHIESGSRSQQLEAESTTRHTSTS